MVTAEQITEWVKAKFPDAQVSVLGDDGQHFKATVVSNTFQGKTLLQQHRLVYAALEGRMESVIHALALKTGTPED